jgi:hypothetical protein
MFYRLPLRGAQVNFCQLHQLKTHNIMPDTSCTYASILQTIKGEITEQLLENDFTLIKSTVAPVDARVEWLEVRVSPRIMIRFGDQSLHSPIYSVSCITADTGEQFFADFTVEQFGYDGTFWFMKKDERISDFSLGQFGFDADMWFMKENDYYDQVTNKKYWELAHQDCVDEIDESIVGSAEDSKMLRAVQGATGYVDEAEYRDLRVEEREAWLKDKAVQAVLKLERVGE